MGAERRIVDLAWGHVSYLEWGPRSASASSTLLLLHGGGLDSAALSWGGVGPALAEAGCRVIAPDHPGYGQTPPAPWLATQERLVAYVGELVEALSLDRYAIGGLSLGGGMTIGHVLRRPQGVTGALLFGSYGLMDHQFQGSFARPAHVLTWMMLRTGMLNAVMRSYGKDRTRRLRSFPRPVLMVHGDHDTGVPVARAEHAARRLPEVRLVVVPNAGHWVQRDRPDIVLPAILDFLHGLD